MGGIVVDQKCATRVPGLYVCGETAGGLHGANRLSGNASSQILVQGHAAGMAAAAYTKGRRQSEISDRDWARICDELAAPLMRDDGIPPHEVKDELQRLANVSVGMLRSKAGLDEALSGARRLRRDALPRLVCRSKDRLYNKEWADAIECRSMIDTIEATALCALKREESRGAHYREDFPVQSNREAPWNGILTMQGGEMIHSRRVTHTHRLAPPIDHKAAGT
jgi:succinate dehydrogenase/fumarate reductase flavoprotein subunit